MVDVERPRWPVCVGLCPPATPHPEGPPPITSLTFYTRASASSEAGFGLCCRAATVTVSFDKQGAVTGLYQGATVGWLGALGREKGGSGAAGIAALSTQYANYEARCRALPTTRQFVPAFDPLDGERAIIAVALIHDSMVKNGPIRVTCTIDFFSRQPCGTAAKLRSLAQDVTVAKITGVNRVAPRTGALVTSGPADSGCYDVQLAQPFGSSDQIHLCVRVTDTLTVTRAAFSRSHVVY